MSDEINYIDIKEFRELGFLQELNREFLHPLGLALEVRQEDDGTERLGGVWDYRDDPEGMIFHPCEDRVEERRCKQLNVEEERKKHIEARSKMFNGAAIQPIS